MLMLAITCALILTACGSESKEEVIDQVTKKIDEVENYDTDASLTISVTDLSTNDLIEESALQSLVTIDHKDEMAHGKIISDGEQIEFYSTKDGVYAQYSEGLPWEDMPSQDQLFSDDDTTYPNIAHILADIADEEDLEMEQDGDAYIFTFSGTNETIYEAFEEPYSLTMTGAEPKDMEHDLEISVDRKSYAVNHVKNTMSAEGAGQELEFDISQTFDQINDIDPIDIPQEVIAEVNNQKGGQAAMGEPEVDEDIEKVISQIDHSIDQVNSYATEATLGFLIKDLSTGDMIEDDTAGLKIDMIEDTLESSGETLENGQTMSYYSTADATYAQFGDEAWEDMTDQESDFKNDETLYADVAQIIVDMAGEADVNMEEKNEKYIFTFTGNSEVVYAAFEHPYSLSLTGLEPKDMKQDVAIVVDSETFIVEEVENLLSAEADGMELEVTIHQTYDNINEIDAITIPQDVIEEAK